MNAPLIINPNSVKLLLWQNVYPSSQENEVCKNLVSAEQNKVSTKQIYYTLKIGDQRFISSVRKDKKGTTYWRFRDYKKAVKGPVEAPAEAVANAPISNG